MAILNHTAIPASKRAKALLNIIAYIGNPVDEDGNQPTDLERINQFVWDQLKKCNRRGQDIRNDAAADPVEDISVE